mmetsp:Transcript_64544/g.179567  ORF Transcript_64544/g.179567 Transcript_64544/m.179567 type:complete len:261 (+) Transcript_64544:71-853(+)
MLTIAVAKVNGSHFLNAEVSPTDHVSDLRSKVEHAFGGLRCCLTAAGNQLHDADTIESVVQAYGLGVTAVVDSATVQARYLAAGQALDELKSEEWEALSAVALDDNGLPPSPLETCAELICRILGVKAEKALDKELEEEQPGEGRLRDDWWSAARLHVFANPSCIAAALPTGVFPLPANVATRVLRFGPGFEFAAQSIGQDVSDALGDEEAEEDEEDGEDEDAGEEDLAQAFAAHPRAAGLLCQWAFAVKALAESEAVYA